MAGERRADAVGEIGMAQLVRPRRKQHQRRRRQRAEVGRCGLLAEVNCHGSVAGLVRSPPRKKAAIAARPAVTAVSHIADVPRAS
ncbi:MAG: hypothetical protein ABI745_05580 [Caldimonas sp.]